MAIRLLLFAALLLLQPSGQIRAEGWSPALAPRPHLPSRFLAVDMGRQRAFVVQNSNGELSRREMPCTTGMRNGGKLLDGDRKTPEGVYFLDGVVTSGLDFDSFGNTALPLNYPNPADRILDKTGDGIMIHGRGRSFGPRQTLGCVVLENDEVDRLGRAVRIHATPIVIAENLTWAEARKSGPPPEIIMGTWGWAKSRERREHAFFEIYDPVRFEKSSGVSLERFKSQTLREFSRREWEDIRMEDMQVLEGPGYVVSAFAQRTFPDGEQGWRRLYWMRHLELWKIVGEEWIPARLGKGPDYDALVDGEIRQRLRECARAWDGGDVKALRQAYDATARRNGEHGRDAIAAALARELDTARPNPFLGAPSVRVTKQGVEARLQQSGRPSRTLLFLPGAFDTWLIVREEG
jgi:hypothetical protein